MKPIKKKNSTSSNLIEKENKFFKKIMWTCDPSTKTEKTWNLNFNKSNIKGWNWKKNQLQTKGFKQKKLKNKDQILKKTN